MRTCRGDHIGLEDKRLAALLRGALGKGRPMASHPLGEERGNGSINRLQESDELRGRGLKVPEGIVYLLEAHGHLWACQRRPGSGNGDRAPRAGIVITGRASSNAGPEERILCI
jgi:hypothetical protein